MALMLKSKELSLHKKLYPTSHLPNSQIHTMLNRLFTHNKKSGFLKRRKTTYKVFLFNQCENYVSTPEDFNGLLTYKNGKEVSFTDYDFFRQQPDYKPSKAMLRYLNSAFNEFDFRVGEENEIKRCSKAMQAENMHKNENSAIVVARVEDALLLKDFVELARNTNNRYAWHLFLLRNEFNPDIRVWVKVFEMLGEPRASAPLDPNFGFARLDWDMFY
jgi:hypothetical protein